MLSKAILDDSEEKVASSGLWKQFRSLSPHSVKNHT